MSKNQEMYKKGSHTIDDELDFRHQGFGEAAFTLFRDGFIDFGMVAVYTMLILCSFLMGVQLDVAF